MTEREIDRIRIRELLGTINDVLRRLQELGRLPEVEFTADFRNTESAKYLLIVGIAAAIDICNHIAARRGGRAPQDYADCFVILQELGVMDEELASKLQQMARFRNLLVHLYTQVDNRRTYQVIQSDIDDLDTFRRAILAWIGQ